MKNTTKQQTLGVVRHVLTAGGGYAVGKGYIDESIAMELVGVITTVVGIVWSWLSPEKKQDQRYY